MSEMEMTNDVVAEEGFTDELSDEALDREAAIARSTALTNDICFVTDH